MISTINNDEEYPRRRISKENDRCTECGSTFKMHQEFPYIRYMKPMDLLVQYFSETEDIEICVPIDNYGTCYSYKMSLYT